MRKKNDPVALLREVGEALDGPRWQTELSRRHDVADRSVRRWLDGSRQIPETIWPELAAEMKKRRAILGELLKRLP